MWEDLIQKAKEGGLDVIETYVFWNVHEPSPGNVLYSLSLLCSSQFIYALYFCPNLAMLCVSVFSIILKGDMTWLGF